MQLAIIRRWFYMYLSTSFVFHACLSQESDTISAGQSLFPNQTIVSKQRKFELGFFSPGNSSNSYVGIWYKNISVDSVPAVVWVANRNNPIRPPLENCRLDLSNGTLKLVVNEVAVWESEGAQYASEAVIFDTGNLVLRNVLGIIWQSFDYPTDTWLPGGVVGPFQTSSANLVSWRNPDDPGFGKYSLGVAEKELMIKRRESQKLLWRTGVLQAGSLPSYPHSILYFYYVKDENSGYLAYNVSNDSLMFRMVISPEGSFMGWVFSEDHQKWVLYLTQPTDSCKIYLRCGANAMCSINDMTSCGCLDGYEPRVKQNWETGDFSSGCVRTSPLKCDKDGTWFIKVGHIKLPANPEWLDVARDGVCEFVCIGNCSCSAYALDSQGRCLLFWGDLLDLERIQGNNTAAGDLYVKMEFGPPAKGKKNVLVVALVVPIIAVIIICCLCLCCLGRKLINKEKRKTYQNLILLDLNSNERAYTKRSNGSEERMNNQHELPIFSFSSISASTDDFSSLNKLGEGGYGPVYKGELLNKQFVAVKRLSNRSGQGLEEFRNETELIAKLQHRNLVGILGCCIENDEKILVYEYMPNKSLDFFIFDPARKEQLNWTKRLHIIEGIAQGLLYLHHYSRLRIVHRDLKASNVLLDAEMHPKISDFGMARIFGGNGSQENTKRIVGTYGYMSPEYAMEGFFSAKSDVFAFGVLMLEILSGKKNTGFYGSLYLSLLGYAWNTWQNGTALELLDSTLEIPSSSSSIPLRCIQIGLLCVQENPTDRPDMSQVVSMLNNKDSTIATPLHPAFTVGRFSDKTYPAEKQDSCSVNGLTVTQLDAR